MKRFLMMAAVGALALPAAATAQVTGVVTQSQAQLQFNPASGVGVNGFLDYSGQNIAGVVYDGAASTAQYQVTTQIQTNDIAFANGATTSGAYDYSTTTTAIVVSFTNNGPAPVQPQLESAILPGGFGFYLATTAGCDLSSTAGCPQVPPAPALGFGALERDPAAPTGTDLAGAAFSLTISSGGGVMESLSGSITLFYNPADPASPIVVTTLGGLASSLNGFGLATPAGSNSAIGYQWNQTALSVNFPPGLLAPEASDSLTYTTVVSDYTRADCLKACEIVAYGGFGDPIGESGGSGGDAFTPASAGPSSIAGVSYASFAFDYPTFKDGVLYFEPVDTVPEPGGWALMLLGSGLIGVRLRRGRPGGRLSGPRGRGIGRPRSDGWPSGLRQRS